MTARLTSRPAKLPWLVTAGHTATATLLFEDEDGVALDMSDRTFEAGWSRYAGATAYTSITVDDSAAASGQLILTIDNSDTDELTGGYYWFLREIIDGEPSPLFDGKLDIAPIGQAGITGTAANSTTAQVGGELIQIITTSVTGPVTTASGIDGGGVIEEGDWFLDGGTP